jgi:hypothetical protein
MRRPQLHRANNSKRWYTFDQKEEQPSPYERTPLVPCLGSTAVNAFFIAGLVALFPSPDKSPEVIGVTPPMWALKAPLAAFTLSAFLCLLVVRVFWRFFHHVPMRPTAEADYEHELRHLANVIGDRTRYYWFGWISALAGFALTLAWWWGWRVLLV